MRNEDRALYKKAGKAIKRIVKLNNTTIDEVRKSIEEAIMIGINSPDKKVKDTWNDIPCKGNLPSPEEVIVWTLRQYKNIEKTEVSV